MAKLRKYEIMKFQPIDNTGLSACPTAGYIGLFAIPP
jgi:hypothetical protein